jgi:hypothetical protein
MTFLVELLVKLIQLNQKSHRELGGVSFCRELVALSGYIIKNETFARVVSAEKSGLWFSRNPTSERFRGKTKEHAYSSRKRCIGKTSKSFLLNYLVYVSFMVFL